MLSASGIKNESPVHLPLDELQCCLYISRVDHVEDVISTKKKACRLVELNWFIEQNLLLNYHQAASTENASCTNNSGVHLIYFIPWHIHHSQKHFSFNLILFFKAGSRPWIMVLNNFSWIVHSKSLLA